MCHLVAMLVETYCSEADRSVREGKKGGARRGGENRGRNDERDDDRQQKKAVPKCKMFSPQQRSRIASSMMPPVVHQTHRTWSFSIFPLHLPLQLDRSLFAGSSRYLTIDFCC